jgi:hypothetical protein
MLLALVAFFYFSVSYILQSNLEIKFKRRKTRYQKILERYNEHFKKSGVMFAIGEYGSFIHIHIYNKSSNTKAEILNKLVEKGKQIDQDSIIRIYGDDNRIGGINYGEKNGGGGGHNLGDKIGGQNYRDNSRMGDEEGSKKYNITDNNFNPNNNDEDDELGYKKGMN